MATISGVYSCLPRMYTCCSMLFECLMFRHFLSSFNCWMMTLSHWLHWCMLIINPEYRLLNSRNVCISQLTLSLYLMTQCQLKLHHSVTSLAQTLRYVKVGQRRQKREHALDQLTLKLIKRKVFQTLSAKIRSAQSWVMRYIGNGRQYIAATFAKNFNTLVILVNIQHLS